jgi:hypothetical protein
MPFREKSAWITLITTIAVYGAYFALIGPRLLAGGSGPADFIGPLSGAVLLLIVLHIALTAIAAVIDPKGARAPHDERERFIQLRADRAGFYTLQTGAFCAIVTIFWWRDAALMANGVFLAMTLAEIARAGGTIIGFRQASL